MWYAAYHIAVEVGMRVYDVGLKVQGMLMPRALEQMEPTMFRARPIDGFERIDLDTPEECEEYRRCRRAIRMYQVDADLLWEHYKGLARQGDEDASRVLEIRKELLVDVGKQ